MTIPHLKLASSPIPSLTADNEGDGGAVDDMSVIDGARRVICGAAMEWWDVFNPRLAEVLPIDIETPDVAECND
jgi:hypothetical protein